MEFGELFICCSLALSLSVFQNQAARLPVNGSLGQSISLSPVIPHGLMDVEVIWKRSSRRLRIARYSKKHVSYFGSEDYQKRIKFHPGNFSLQISDLQREDAGSYEVVLTKVSGVETPETIQLDVYEPVTGTKISYKLIENCNLTLTCSVNTGDNISFRWWRGQEALRNGSSHHLSDNGQELQLHFTEETNDAVYVCEARNPVSEGTAQFNTAQFNVSGVCKGIKPAEQSCCSPCYVKLIISVTILTILLSVIVIVQVISKRTQLRGRRTWMQTRKELRGGTEGPLSELDG
ncbi:T-lymphocyte surface antigen Ly-9-like [Scyliorhinus canicula]|uniref:T-lymphocyte surface antigen Ly-9-like n=1 Tax=Scyliorhinus canicula TaxID=7830 RepID=UPI0018F68B64|nr:T-lymphocyte surface antigen Ly-9-like [Scyliorhinus canicula]